MEPPLDTDRLARAIAPVVAKEVEARSERLLVEARARWLEERSRASATQALLLDACRAVGAAVDRLEQARFTAREIAARRALEEAARRLKFAMAAKAGGRRG